MTVKINITFEMEASRKLTFEEACLVVGFNLYAWGYLPAILPTKIGSIQDFAKHIPNSEFKIDYFRVREEGFKQEEVK